MKNLIKTFVVSLLLISCASDDPIITQSRHDIPNWLIGEWESEDSEFNIFSKLVVSRDNIISFDSDGNTEIVDYNHFIESFDFDLNVIESTGDLYRIDMYGGLYNLSLNSWYDTFEKISSNKVSFVKSYYNLETGYNDNHETILVKK